MKIKDIPPENRPRERMFQEGVMKNKDMGKSEFSIIVRDIKSIIRKARYNAFNAVNTEMLKAYYEIGRKIVEEEQKGGKRAGYGEKLIDTLSRELMKEFKKGFDVTNLRRMRRFYMIYQKWETVSPKLTWSHYSELIKIEEDIKIKLGEKTIEKLDRISIETSESKRTGLASEEKEEKIKEKIEEVREKEEEEEKPGFFKRFKEKFQFKVTEEYFDEIFSDTDTSRI